MFLKFFLHSLGPFQAAPFEIFQKMLILAFPKLHIFWILEHHVALQVFCLQK